MVHLYHVLGIIAHAMVILALRGQRGEGQHPLQAVHRVVGGAPLRARPVRLGVRTLTLGTRAVQAGVMRIFLSHSSKQKPLVREIKALLPRHLDPWLDEQALLIGDSVSTCLERVIKTDCDYVLLFLDVHAAKSEWVRKEVAWALEAERKHGRLLLLPIVLEDGAMALLGQQEVVGRKHLALGSYSETSVRALAQGLAAELFALVCRDLQAARSPSASGPMQRLHDTERELAAEAALVRKAVFPHRAENPISRRRLLEVLNSQVESPLSEAELNTVLLAVSKRGLIPGLSYDGVELFLIEEHASWKADLNRERKEQIAQRAIKYVRNGGSVFLDAGSTTEELARLICRRIETRLLTRLTIATTSVHIADMLSDCCIRMGFDDEFTAIKLLIPGGGIRPNTQAIVPIDAEYSDIRRLARSVSGFDVCFIGVNGIHDVEGFTTHGNAEQHNKREILEFSRKCFVVGDSSKIGLRLECQFARWEDDVTLIVDRQPDNATLQKIISERGARVILAEGT